MVKRYEQKDAFAASSSDGAGKETTRIAFEAAAAARPVRPIESKSRPDGSGTLASASVDALASMLTNGPKVGLVKFSETVNTPLATPGLF